MRILKIDLKRLHNEEWFNLFTDLFALAPVYGVQVLGIKGLFDLLEPLYEKSDMLLQLMRKSSYTEKLSEAEKGRNTLFRAMYGVIKASQSLPEETKRDAAKRLFILASEYRKSVLHKSYSEETGAIFNFLQDLQGAYAADVALLQLGSWVSDLQAAEQKFVDIRAQRTKEDIQKPVEKLGDIRKQADILYNGIVDALYVKLLADGLGGDTVVDPEELKTGPYEENVPEEQRGNVVYNFVIAWNRVLKKYADMLAGRAGRRVKDQDPEEDEPEGPVEG
ncbi:MAG: DUF6261 family protein [Tannerellaceae bacterium]|jgi:hypothetical protein|nr:DUF6261 family protein [Tannerellaceae bacterium]